MEDYYSLKTTVVENSKNTVGPTGVEIPFPYQFNITKCTQVLIKNNVVFLKKRHVYSIIASTISC